MYSKYVFIDFRNNFDTSRSLTLISFDSRACMWQTRLVEVKREESQSGVELDQGTDVSRLHQHTICVTIRPQRPQHTGYLSSNGWQTRPGMHPRNDHVFYRILLTIHPDFEFLDCPLSNCNSSTCQTIPASTITFASIWW